MNRLEQKLYKQDIETAWESLSSGDLLKNQSIMITGATGMIGTVLTDILMYGNQAYGNNIRIIAMGRSTAKAKERFGEYWKDPLFSFMEHDINFPFPDEGKVKERPDFIIHAASTTHPVAYAKEPVQTITVNMIGLYHLLELVRRTDVIRLAFVSSVEVYGENRGDVERFTEEYCGYIDCNTVRAGYPESKRVGEALCQAYAAQYGTDVVIPRLSRVYGPTMQETDSKAIAQFIRKAVDKENIVLKSAGNQLYSYCYVTDAAAGILKVLLEGEKGSAYNIADRKSEATLKELAEMLAEAAGTQTIFEMPDETEKAGYSKATKALLSTEKIEKTGWRAAVHLKDGLYKTVKLCRGNKESMSGEIG